MRNRTFIDIRTWRVGCAVAGIAAALIMTGRSFAEESEFAGLIRGKSPDRGSYQAPSLPAANRPAGPQSDAPPSDRSGTETGQVTLVQPRSRTIGQAVAMEGDNEVAQVGHHFPTNSHHVEYGHGVETVYDPSCGLESFGSCDGGCDSFCSGCDQCCGPSHCGPTRLCLNPNQWFGSVELMLMYRSGDSLPVLATTATAGGNAAIPGVPAGSTRVLFGGERLYDDMTPGGRVMLGTWLDPSHCHSLVFHGWAAGQETFNFATDSSQNAIIGRPFLNVSPGAPNPPNDALLVASPGLNRTGSLAIRGTSEVFGGDIALRRQWLSGLGGVVEVLYGYQHMRLNEDLDISSTTFEPGSPVVGVRDFFEAENEFHGGEFGLTTRYREGCWSFDGTIKVAAGSVRRTATLDGTTTGIPDNGGLLIRASNEGEFRNSTFGWVPELNATLGYRYTRNLDFTIGYHVIAMTDALQVSGMIDPQLAVNTSFPNGVARPGTTFRYGTFHVQSIHFGLQYVY